MAVQHKLFYQLLNQLVSKDPNFINMSSEKRRENPVSPFERILKVKGKEWIQKKYQNELQNANSVNKAIVIADCQKFDDPRLDYILPVRPPPPVQCKTKGGVGNYPVFKVRLDSKQNIDKLVEVFGEEQRKFDQSSVPLDLHKVSVLEANGWSQELVELAKKGEDVGHRCHTKNCFEKGHCYFVSKHVNISHQYCKVWINVNGVNFNICTHEPKCLFPGEQCNLK